MRAQVAALTERPPRHNLGPTAAVLSRQNLVPLDAAPPNNNNPQLHTSLQLQLAASIPGPQAANQALPQLDHTPRNASAARPTNAGSRPFVPSASSDHVNVAVTRVAHLLPSPCTSQNAAGTPARAVALQQQQQQKGSNSSSFDAGMHAQRRSGDSSGARQLLLSRGGRGGHTL